jgi:hypothetical protein
MKLIKKGSEAEIQAAVVKYLKHHKDKPLFCASAGGMKASYMQAARMKATGYVAGFPDLFIYEPRGGYHGLAIELKREGGYASTEQKAWITSLSSKGYDAYICKGIDDAIRTIDQYLSR